MAPCKQKRGGQRPHRRRWLLVPVARGPRRHPGNSRGGVPQRLDVEPGQPTLGSPRLSQAWGRGKGAGAGVGVGSTRHHRPPNMEKLGAPPAARHPPPPLPPPTATALSRPTCAPTQFSRHIALEQLLGDGSGWGGWGPEAGGRRYLAALGLSPAGRFFWPHSPPMPCQSRDPHITLHTVALKLEYARQG
jgi:hypothetical protein